MSASSSITSSIQSSSGSGNFNDEDRKIHYEMLKYIYDNQALGECKYAYMWNRFKETHVVNKTAEELKYIFNRHVLCNISDYDELEQDQQKYFEVIELLDLDETKRILKYNEPQAGLDFKLITENDEDSTDSELDDTKLEIMFKENLKNCRTYKGVFEEDVCDESQQNILKIKKPSLDDLCEEGEGEMQYELAKIFSLLLLTDEERNEGGQQLSHAQIFDRLKTNRDLLANAKHVFNKPREESTLPDSNSDNFSSSDPGPILTQHIEASTPYECEPSRASTSHYVTPINKSKTALVPNPCQNPRMTSFVERFKHSKKRPRRSTLSPKNPTS
ncbi:unnamed protein product [Diamesa serratosioi]